MKPRSLTSLFLLLLAPLAAHAQDLDSYRRYALTHEGNVTNGARLFAGEKLGCAKCHSIDGRATLAGPDLYAVGDKFGRRDIVEAILQPSASIAPGYGAVLIETKLGAEFLGTLKQNTDTMIELMGADGKAVSFRKTDIVAQRGSSTSLMPEGLQGGLTQDEFTDLIEYLATLRQPETTLASNHGMPLEIPALARAVGIRPIFQPLNLPRGRAQAGLTSMRQIPSAPNRFLVLHQSGVIWQMEHTASGETKSVFADLTKEVFYERGPNGLLDVVFHPKFRENRKYYVKYQVFEENTVATVVVERHFAPDFKTDAAEPGRRILKIKSVAEDHSGGCLQFGPDGFLYIVMGDTGPHNDPNGHAQNLGLLLGKLLRIDVDHGAPYAVPTDNPFVNTPGARPEIWAYGLRNPWRFCFDRLTGDLWMADVGQDRVEEIDIVRKGENYGWNVYEGYEPFSNQYKKEGRQFTPPVFAYKRKYGNSITGGYVYRGDKKSSFYGAYIFGDYTSKRIFAMTQENNVLKRVRQITTIPQSLVSFSEDEAGNIYALGYEGLIYQLNFTTANFND